MSKTNFSQFSIVSIQRLINLRSTSTLKVCKISALNSKISLQYVPRAQQSPVYPMLTRIYLHFIYSVCTSD